MPAYLTPEMRRALRKLAQTRPPFGLIVGPDGVPASTAKALERRHLARIEGRTVLPTDGGRLIGERILAEGRQRLREVEGEA